MVSLLSLVFCLVNQHVGGFTVLNGVSFSLLYKKSLGMDNEEEERCEVHRSAEVLSLSTEAGGVCTSQ